jgi:C-terminal processing protease CtpA/Prc
MSRTCLLLTLVCALQPAVAQEPKNTSAGDKADAAQVLAIIDSVVEHHIDPPTRHHLVHEFCKTLSGQYGLARNISKARSDDDLRRLIEEAAASKSAKQATNAITQVFVRLPVPVGLSSVDNHKVNIQVAENRYVGTGIQLAMKPKPVMVKVFEDGPAHKVGALDGDIIESIDGDSTDGLGIMDVITKLRGPAGSKVQVTLRQATASNSRQYTITRGLVPL